VTAPLIAQAPLALVIAGVVKAGAIIWAGPKIGIPDWVLATSAALWITGPASVAWFWKRRQQLRASVAAVARPESAG